MESIRVAVRIRPDEVSFGESCLQIDECSTALKISRKLDDSNRSETFDYAFDNVFGPGTSQEEVFSDVRELINESLNGFNVTVFAFGMTGSGKTFTIAGNPQNPGIVPRTVNHIFTDLQQKSNKKGSMAMVFLTYVELYNNSLYDLLAAELPDDENAVGLKLHEHPKKGMQISGSPTLRAPVTSAEQALKLIANGNKLRATSSTNLNERSSRSHTVISFEIVSQDISAASARVGKINLVDLAGSERVKQSGAEGQAMEEAKQINKALSVLGDVLNSLSKFHQGQTLKSPSAPGSKVLSPTPHIPFRNSKLTMLLKDSLGGNAKTMMIATIRTSAAFYQQSLVSLRYAARARHIKCNPIQNVADTVGDGVGNIMQQTLLEVNRLKAQLEHRNEESNTLKARLIELEKLKIQSERKGTTFGEETKQKLLEQIDELQVRSGKERQELTERLRSVIHSHEGTLAAKEKVYVHLEGQLALKASHIEALSYEHREALVSKERAELTTNSLLIKIAEKEKTVDELKAENSIISDRLIEESNRRDAIIESGAREKELLVDALQKMTSSRNKHKKRSGEFQININKLSNDVAEKTNEISDVINLQLQIEESVKKIIECSDQKERDNEKINEIEILKKKAEEESEYFRSENVLLMENLVRLDGERRKEAIRLKSESEEEVKVLKDLMHNEEKERSLLRDQTKELSIELKDCLEREAEANSEGAKISEQYKLLQLDCVRLKNNSTVDSERERAFVQEISALTQKLSESEKYLESQRESDERCLVLQKESEGYKLRAETAESSSECSTTELGSLRERLVLLLEDTARAADSRAEDSRCHRVEMEALEGTMQERTKRHEDEVIGLLAAAEELREEISSATRDAKDMTHAVDAMRSAEALLLSEIEDIKGRSGENECRLQAEVEEHKGVIATLRGRVSVGDALQETVSSLRHELQVSHDTNNVLKAENDTIRSDYERTMAELNRTKSESEGAISSLSNDIKSLNEILSNSMTKEESDIRERIIKHEYGKKILLLTEQLVQSQSENGSRDSNFHSHQSIVQDKVEIAEEKSQNFQEKLDKENGEVEEKSLNIRNIEVLALEGTMEKESKESEALKSRIALMVSQEEDMFSSLKGRLEDLDVARSKLIKLQQSAVNGEKSDLQLYLLAEQQEAQLCLEEKLVSFQVKIISVEAELKRSRDSNKDLRMELEKRSKQLALEQQKSKAYLSDRDRIRKTTAEDLKNTVSLVRKRVEIGQIRRHSELIARDNRDNMLENLSSIGRMYQQQLSQSSASRSDSIRSRSSIRSVKSDEISADTVGSGGIAMTISFEETMDLKKDE